MFRLTGSGRDRRLGIVWLSAGFFAAHQLFELLLAVAYHRPFLETCHWDCKWYGSISQGGYALSAGAANHQTNWAFFPLFPLLVGLLMSATAMPVALASVLLGKVFFLCAIYAFTRFAQRYSEQMPPWHAGFVAAFSPYAVYGDAGYTEPLFLLLTCVFFVCLLDRRYLACGVVGALLSATRVPGILVALPYAIVAAREFLPANAEQRVEMVLGGLLMPLGLALFMLHLYAVTGDALAFVHVQKAWGRPLSDPLSVVVAGFAKGTIHLEWALMSTLAVALAVYLMFTHRLILGIFSLFCTLIPLSSGLQSMPRYIWWQAPILLVLANLMRRRAARVVLIPLFLLGLAYMYVAWMANKSWAV